ncbi:unnamed protein product [Closterium sp. NIES-53]
MLGDFHAKDVFRELYPDERQFTFYCKSAKVSSRIDRVLVSQSMLHLVMEVKHKKVPVGITDHMFAVRLRLGWRGPRESGPGLWRFPARLLKRPGVAKAIAEVVRKHREEGCGDFDRLTRGLTAKLKKYDKEERKRVKLTRGILEEQVEQLQHKVMADPYDDEVQALLSSREGSRYSWSEQEVKQALKELANDKSPGWDGLPKELFQQHWELLREPMMKMIGEFTATGKLPDAANEAVTILLYKKGAETDIKNYRPITLISGVYKLLAKVVATRMKAVLGQVISKEQHGFLPGRRLTDAVSMVADMIEAGRNENSDWYLLLIDFEKAYDSVRRGFMMDTVAKLGFPPRFVRWIEALHRDVHTRLCVNGWVGEQIEMRKGVRQGCPLVPYLFLCAVEPLSRLAEERKLGIGEEYAEVSGLKVNKGKSPVLPLGRNVGQQAPGDTEYKWVGANEVERLLGVWISPGGDTEATWEKAFDRAAGELSKWSNKYLTTGARVTIINNYVLPIFLFQAQVYPPDDLLWRRVEKLIEKFVSGNHADTERHFRLWSGDLIYTSREQGGLGVIDPRGRIDSVAMRCAGMALQQECSLRRGLTEKAAGLPLGWATLYAHKAVLRGGLFKSRRWARLCKTLLKSTVVAVPGAAFRWDAEEEFLCYNRHIIHRGDAPFGGQKGTEKLRKWRMRDMVHRKWDGTRTLKSEVTLARELGGNKEAEMALKAFNAAPERWRQWLLAPLTAEEVAAESSVVCTRLPSGQRCLWEICGKMGKKVELRGLSGKGERTSWDVRLVLCCDSVVPARLSREQAIREAGDPRARLLSSSLFKEEVVVPVRELREPSKGIEAVEGKRLSWEARAGRKIDWERSRRVRDSLVVPAKARDVLLRVHNLNLQVGERVLFVKGGVACPNCGLEETLEHCLLECRSVAPVARAVKSALSMMQPARRVDRLADFVFGEEETKSGFPEATMVAVAMHQVWLGRCGVSLRKGKRFQARKVLRRINVEFNKHARIYCGKPSKQARKDKARWNLAEDEARVVRRICVSEAVGLKWQGDLQSIWSNHKDLCEATVKLWGGPGEISSA